MDWEALLQAQEALDQAIEEAAYEQDGEAKRLVLQAMLSLRTALKSEKGADMGGYTMQSEQGGGMEMFG